MTGKQFIPSLICVFPMLPWVNQTMTEVIDIDADPAADSIINTQTSRPGIRCAILPYGGKKRYSKSISDSSLGH